MAIRSDSASQLARQAMETPLPVVSCDGHAGPRLVEDLRPYCPQKYLQQFDDYVAELAVIREREAGRNLFTEGAEPDDAARIIMSRFANMQKTLGHYDMTARLKDMDKDGVTAEVIFPSSHNFQSEPFIRSDLFLDPTKGDTELFKVGMHIYASWLVDAVKAAPTRLIGLVTPPLWDIPASVAEVEWAAKAGLRGVFLVMPRPGIPRYDNPEWEPFWAACAAHDMTLNCHAGAPLEDGVVGPHTFCMHEIETGGWPARKPVHQLVFGGVLERHPTLKLVVTEQNFDWWTTSMREFDSSYLTHRFQLKRVMPRKPSDYCRSNVYIGASFIAPFEADDAVRNGYVDNVMWGRDYGHIEGTFVPTEDDDPKTNPSRLSMRYAFAKIPPGDIRKMVSDTGINFYDLNREELSTIARRINAPSLDELTSPIAAIPQNGGVLAFRQIGAWG